MPLALIVALGLAAPAAAHVCDESIQEVAFRGLVLQTQAAVDRGDVELHARIVAELEAMIPCLGFAPPPRLWADYLVSVAIRDFTAGGDWQPELAAALQIRPGIDRGVGSAHPLARWEPEPSSGGDGGPAPAGIALYVDGLPAQRLPPAEGLHLVQRRDGRWWSTLLLLDEVVPDAWLATPAEGPPRIVVRATAASALTLWSVDQELLGDWESDWVRPGGVRVAVVGRVAGTVTFFSRFGVAGEVTHPLTFGRGLQLEGRAAGVVAGDRSALGAGLGLVHVDVFEGRDWRLVRLAYPHVYGQLRGPDRRRWELVAVVGGRSYLSHAQLYGALPIRPADGGAWRIGLDLRATRALFEQPDRGHRDVAIQSTRVGLQLERQLGER